MDTTLLFIGHTHIPFCFCNKGEGWFQIEDNEIEINPEYNYIVNVGSVGQPRDRDPRSSFVVYNPNTNLLKFKRYEYNIKAVQEKFTQTDLPEEFSARLAQGR
jgi:diadenosine tetraphosphatase ApaH/serine/threonine PP2A family protein phosphatase